ncbi:MAG: S8 family serine peptidase [Desulfobacteraceae bacterium]|nr:S8 family serine peptidase [Desulfobacteraceae bacterium]
MFSARTIIGICVVAVTISLVGTTTVYAGRQDYVPGELLVRFKPGQRQTGAKDYAHRLKIRSLNMPRNTGIQHVALPRDLSVQEALKIYAKDERVAFAEPNYYIHTQAELNDPSFALQWALHNTGQNIRGKTGASGNDIDALRAWDMTTGSSRVVIAVVDTGVNHKHPELENNLWTNPNEIPDNGIDDDENGFIDDVHGWDFVDGDNIAQDAAGHGTHISGIIAAKGANAAGISGVTWQAGIMPLRFLNANGSGTTSDAIKAIKYAAAQGARIINCSWGSTGYSASMRSIIQKTDALFVCAAGNNGTNNDYKPFYPASYELTNIISVAATDQNDELAWFSNFGKKSVDIAAPGTIILSLASGREVVWEDDFNSAALTNWTLGGDNADWDAVYPPYSGSSETLANSPDYDYPAQSDSWAMSPAIDLQNQHAPGLSFIITGSAQDNADFLYVEVSTDGQAWKSRPVMLGSTLMRKGISGTLPYWTPATVDLGAWENQSQLYFRFRFISDEDETGTGDGYFIDNVSVTAAADSETYQYLQGTSMAAGFISGIAGLICSENEDLKISNLKSIIEKSVDLRPNLKQNLVSEGRANAYNSLTLISDFSLKVSNLENNTIMLSWSAAINLNDQVQIERRAAGKNEFEIIAFTDASNTTYTDNGLSENTIYYYRLKIKTSSNGLRGYSPQIDAVIENKAAKNYGAGTSGGGGGGGGGCFITSVLQ